MCFTRSDAFPTRAEPLGIRLSLPSPGCLVAEIIGELDLTTAPTLQVRLSRALRAEPLTELVVDLRRVEFLAVAGIAALLELREHARRQGVALTLVAPHRAVLRPLALLDLLDTFDVRDTLGT